MTTNEALKLQLAQTAPTSSSQVRPGNVSVGTAPGTSGTQHRNVSVGRDPGTSGAQMRQVRRPRDESSSSDEEMEAPMSSRIVSVMK